MVRSNYELEAGYWHKRAQDAETTIERLQGEADALHAQLRAVKRRLKWQEKWGTTPVHKYDLGDTKKQDPSHWRTSDYSFPRPGFDANKRIDYSVESEILDSFHFPLRDKYKTALIDRVETLEKRVEKLADEAVTAAYLSNVVHNHGEEIKALKYDLKKLDLRLENTPRLWRAMRYLATMMSSPVSKKTLAILEGSDE